VLAERGRRTDEGADRARDETARLSFGFHVDDNKSLEVFMSFSFARSLTSLAIRLAGDDSGADLIEYALLTALFAIVGFLGVTTLTGKMGTIYSKSDNAQQGLWIPDAPAAGS
jgi:Flp pilus assembly pilin Flp